MISKERLQELIKQGATIYAIISEPFIAGYSNELKITPIALNNSYGISVEEYNKQNKCKPKFYQGGFVYRDICDANDIFETEEDAKWELEMTAIRTETLKMPTWEEFVGKLKRKFKFIDKYGNRCSLNGYNDENGGFIDICVDMHQKAEFDYNKENYTEACKLCLKLFKGEK